MAAIVPCVALAGGVHGGATPVECATGDVANWPQEVRHLWPSGCAFALHVVGVARIPGAAVTLGRS